MTRSVHRGLVALLVVAVTACSSSGLEVNRGGKAGQGGKNASAKAGNGGASGPASVGGRSGTGASAAGGSGGAIAGTGGSNVMACTQPLPASTQIPRMKRAAYDAVMKDLLGITTLSTRGEVLPSSMLAADSEGSLSEIAWNGYLAAAEAVASEYMTTSNKQKFITCDPAVDTCLMRTIESFGRKAFRRPVTSREIMSFMRLNNLTPRGTPAEVAEGILRAMLSSPSFILLPELGEEKEGSAYKLTSFEVATRLSFLLWNSIPDELLDEEANNDRLLTKESVLAQARRMMQSDRAKAVAVGFHRFWVGMGNNPSWLTKGAGLAELDAFFADAVLKGKSFKDLFLDNAAFVTEDVAAAYGLDPGAYDATPRPFTLDPATRPGFLTRAGFLTNFAHEKTTSPTRRGAFIMQSLLAYDVGAPDPTFMAMAPPAANYKTHREEIEALTSPASCRTCHAIIDAPGFVLEAYGASGALQTVDPLGGPINGTASVRFSPTTDAKTLASPRALMTELAERPEAQQRYGAQFVSFASGRSSTPYDACVAKQLATNLPRDGYSLANMIVDYTQSEGFRLRTQDN